MPAGRMTDDLFERSTMSFGEHLEQLRVTLLKAFCWLAVGTLVGLYFSDQVVQIIARPFRAQLRQYQLDKLSRSFERANQIAPAPLMLEWMSRHQVVPKRSYQVDIPEFGTWRPLKDESPADDLDWLRLLSAQPELQIKEQVTFETMATNLNSFGIFDSFFIYLQASFAVGVTLGLPGMCWHLWQFIAAGLYPQERRSVVVLIPLASLLFLSGAALAYFVILELVLEVMFNYSTGLDIDLQPRLKDCFSFALWLPVLFGLAFQLPLVMLVLSWLKLASAGFYIEHQRMAILAISLLSMVLTPADPYTFMGLLLPLLLLYYCGIALCRIRPVASVLRFG